MRVNINYEFRLAGGRPLIFVYRCFERSLYRETIVHRTRMSNYIVARGFRPTFSGCLFIPLDMLICNVVVIAIT